MKTVGIIAEYNPFHNGHAYQIETVRRQTGADYIIVAMSGDFVQRGAPAILDKHTRARMALACGADLIIGLPVLWSTASAEDFATAGVLLLQKTGCVDLLCFGAETADLPLLFAIADILTEEPPAFRAALSAGLKRGTEWDLRRPAKRPSRPSWQMPGQAETLPGCRTMTRNVSPAAAPNGGPAADSPSPQTSDRSRTSCEVPTIFSRSSI